ncbi:unnamed protein product [Onchocerca flexuosa]|uniref:Anaphase-promoting complex subunit 2 n=1 Tax=Onchocerca flexuosa TaxID=387005 RepID=A0A183HIM8_9BILA|nr:unnamed protein product [Onchocerca flexuosa]
MDDWNELCKDDEQRLGSKEKALMTCMGIGFIDAQSPEVMEVPVVPWNDFLRECSSIKREAEKSGLSESEWEWLKQLCELAGEDCCSEVNNSFQQITFMLRTISFPVTGPEVISSLGSAFQYSWQNGDTLCSLYHRFIERCLRIDLAVKLCSDVRYPFTFMEWAIDEDDPSCVSISLLF